MSPMLGLLEVGTIPKDKTNQYHGYQYASEAAVTAKFRETMKANGLFVKSCQIVSCERGEVQVRNGLLNSCTVIVRFYFADSDGTEYGPFEGVGSGMDAGDKAPMKALAAARKYAISQAALISWDDDPEADAKTDLVTQNRPAQAEPGFVLEKPEMADTFISLLQEKAKLGTGALESAWAWEGQDQDMAKACRWWAASIDDGTWWRELKASAAKLDTKKKPRTNGRR